MSISNLTQPLISPDNDGLIDHVAGGVLQLPAFQRPYRWGDSPSRTCSLLASIVQGWPAGSILLMDGHAEFGSLPVERWSQAISPEKKEKPSRNRASKRLILDGQQRLTALYLAYFDLDPDWEYVIHLDRIDETGVIAEDDNSIDTFVAYKKGDNETFVGNGWAAREKRASDSVMRVKDFVNDGENLKWLTEAKEGSDLDEDFLAQLWNKGYGDGTVALSRLRTYQFPVTVIPKGIADDALTTIFVEINRQGIPLDTFDLVAAKTIATGSNSFDLRRTWLRLSADEHVARDADDLEEITAELKFLYRFNTKTTPRKKHSETPLKVLLLAQDKGPPKEKDKGGQRDLSLSSRAMVDLEPSYVRSSFENAAKALEITLEFLVQNASLIPDTLADDNYIIPIAVQFFRNPDLVNGSGEAARIRKDRLLRWFWAASLRMLFSEGGTAGLVIEETRGLAKWIADDASSESEPATVSQFWDEWDSRIKQELVQPQKTRTHLMKALLALDTKHGAKDWIGYQPRNAKRPEEFSISSAANYDPGEIKLDVHHLWPKGAGLPEKLKSNNTFPNSTIEIPHGNAAISCILNRCLLINKTNNKVKTSPPHTAKTTVKEINANYVASYLFDPKKQKWNSLAKSRMEAVEEAIRSLIPRSNS